MNIKEHSRSNIDILITFITIFLVVFIDQFLKNFFSEVLSLGESIPVIPKVFHFTLGHNTGIAFGMFKDAGFVWIIIPIVAILLLVFNIYYYWNNQGKLNRLYVTSFSLILGGAISNLLNRIYLGYVIDFIDFRIWPIFNIADSAITIGAFFMVIGCIKQKTWEDNI